MSDKELLKKAARAYFLFYSENLKDPDMKRAIERWNPLENDGDAFRLMASLEISINYLDGFGEVLSEPYALAYDPISVEYSGDIAADTRLAIVRAAATMGDD